MEKSLLRGAARALAFLLLTATLLAVYVAAMPFGVAATARVRRAWCGWTCRLLAIRVECRGQPFAACPTLFVANHVSYLDILALGTCIDATFVAKAEIAGWPLFGPLGRLGRTFFVRRHWRQARAPRDGLAARLRAGESFVLFAEGTSTDGLGVRPLKTSLLSVAEPWILDCPVAVQGVTLAYLRLADGTAIDGGNCDLYAWHGAAELVPHLWHVLQMRGVQLQIVLHEPTLSWSVQNRKLLGRRLRDQISRELASARSAAATSATDVPGATAAAEAH